MTTYLFASIWLISNVLCLAIAKHRHVRTSTRSTLLLSLLGPFAIALVLAAKPDYAQETRQR